jgi:hypothetical protein
MASRFRNQEKTGSWFTLNCKSLSSAKPWEVSSPRRNGEKERDGKAQPTLPKDSAELEQVYNPRTGTLHLDLDSLRDPREEERQRVKAERLVRL